MEIRSLSQLEKALKQKIQHAMEDEVAKTAKDTMQEKIQTEVYNKYTPYSTDGKTPHYERTYELLESVKTNMVNDNTLELTNTRSDGDRYIPEIIEYGQGYEWGYTRDLDEEIGARPFIAKTHEALDKEGIYKQALKKGLQQRGLKVE